MLNAKNPGVTGSEYETPACAVAGDHRVSVEDPGDFREGQPVTLSLCHPHFSDMKLMGPGSPYVQREPVTDEMEADGYDGSAGS